MSERVTIRGITATVVTPEECEKVDVVVCAHKGTPTPFTDNLEAPCSVCGTMLIYRPHAPVTPPKMCFECAPTRESPDIARIDGDARFNDGFHADLAQPSTMADALRDVTRQAVKARQ